MKKKVTKTKSQQLSQDAKIAVFAFIAFLLVAMVFAMQNHAVQAQTQQQPQTQNGSSY